MVLECYVILGFRLENYVVASTFHSSKCFDVILLELVIIMYLSFTLLTLCCNLTISRSFER